MPAREKKRRAAQAALGHVKDGMVLGIGTGSTVAEFVKALLDSGIRLAGAVSSSNATSALLRAGHIPELDLNAVDELALYVDGADEATFQGALIKGGGAALTREKVIAGAAARFVCIIDDGKLVEILGRFPLPVEVVPMARAAVAVGADGVMVEVHHQPELALSDGPQSIYPAQFAEMMDEIEQIARVVHRNVPRGIHVAAVEAV